MTKQEKSGIYTIEAISGSRIGWKYIGQTIHLNIREKEHSNYFKNKKHHSPKLQRYYNKYGPNSLKFSILIECPKEELNYWEEYYIKYFDSHKNGFNCDNGGRHKVDLTKKCSFINIVDKEIYYFNSIKEFAKYANISTPEASTLYRGKTKFAQNWYNPKYDWKPNYYQVIGPDGKQYEVIQSKIIDFCKLYNIKNSDAFSRMLHKKLKSCYNWKLIDAPLRKNQRYYKLINPEGKIIEGYDISKLERQYKLKPFSLRGLFDKRQYKQCHGWTKYKE